MTIVAVSLLLTDPMLSTLHVLLNLPITEIPLLSSFSDEEMDLEVKCLVHGRASQGREKCCMAFQFVYRQRLIMCLMDSRVPRGLGSKVRI